MQQLLADKLADKKRCAWRAGWILRYTSLSGRRREMGLGTVSRTSAAAAGRSLSDARQAAHNARSLFQQGIDPIDERDARRQAQQEALAAKSAEVKRDAATFARVARAYHERVIEPNRSTKHSADWINSLEHHVPAALWHAPIAKVCPVDLLDVIAELQAKIPETSTQIRQRLEAVFDDGMFRGLCNTNPAVAIRRKLSERTKGRKQTNLAAPHTRKSPRSWPRCAGAGASRHKR